MPGKRKVVRRRLADGTIKEYVYERGAPKPRSVGAVIVEYKQSPEFKGLSKKTKQIYQLALGRIGEHFHAVPIADIRRRIILGTRDSFADRPGIANQMVTIWGVLLRFARDREYIEVNPAADIKRLKTGAWEPWTEDQIAQALDALPEYLRRAVIVGLYTGQRAGDVVRMTWADYDGEAIRVRQEKTGADLWIPAHSALKAELDVWKAERTSTHIITKAGGEPWPRSSDFVHAMARTLRKENVGAVYHGLRKTAAVRLAEAGCTAHEIMAVTGHRTYAMVQHYTEGADQRRRATAAVEKLENWRGQMGKK